MSETLQIVHMDDSLTEIELGVEGSLTWHHTPTGLTVTHDEVGTFTRWPWTTVKSYTVLPTPDPIAGDPSTCTNTAPADATRFVTLCVKEGRQNGAVTVSESRIPVVSVLAAIQNRGAVDAAAMYPLVGDDEFAVLTTLTNDLGARSWHIGAPDPATYEQQGDH
jgi:hypothetical protein